MVCTSFFFTAVTGIAYLEQVQADHHLVNGAPLPPDGSIPLRRNVDVLEAESGPQWDLYVQALLEMQDVDAKDPLSYFQIAGSRLHPESSCLEVLHVLTKVVLGQGDGWLGYCPHGENIFLPWHRPYVLLFEEQLVKHALGIAQGYPEKYRDEYVAAAQTLRAPYWDWADQSAVPYASIPKGWNINVTSGKDIAVKLLPNPLYKFNMPKAALNGNFGPFDQRRETERCRVPFFSYPGSADKNLRARNLKRNVYAAFVYAQDFTQFSETGNQGVGLEQIHNWIHGDACCGNQFYQPDLSAFDPLL
ncbi:hypothetical protein NQ176_g9060 [Zarea fungicola]|uniref:Uncharacterized protein n=1 Tax=Zarea fungicola TaxID=93591 RepID=A0ACC1MNU8_9HYPO|nr:hypothetical protein NQ176_g9060 [Lecanicillium fungicola]